MNLALFDFDGTITTRDVYPGFLGYASPRWRTGLGWGLLGLPYLGMKLGLVSPRAMRLAAGWVAFYGAREDFVRSRGRRYAQEVLPTLLRPEAVERLDWHRRQGDRIVVVSASVDAYLRPWCEAQGLQLICNELYARDGRLSGRFRGGDCAGEGKAERVRAHFDLARHAVIYAYGDTEEDRALLALAQRRYYRWRELPA